jgi:hypothetical protein
MRTNNWSIRLIFFTLTLIYTISISAQTSSSTAVNNTNSDTDPGNESSNEDDLVTYTPAFFQRYQVNTALEMVNRVPGFTPDNGGDLRGFGTAVGNILINDKRPSTKQDSPSAILGRISADLVERIELIRVRVRDIDLQGHLQVVNVILNENVEATIRWEIAVRETVGTGTSPGGSISLSDRWGPMEYNVGADMRWAKFGDPATIERFDGNGLLTEIRTNVDNADGPTANGYFNSTSWLGKTFLTFNSRIGLENRDILFTIDRISQIPGEDPRQELITTLRRNKRLELGFDAKRELHKNLLGKAIILYSILDGDPLVSQQDLNVQGVQTRFQLEDEKFSSSEFIARLESDWSGFSGHAIQTDLERAVNILDNAQIFTDDTGAGPVVKDVPGGNTRVEEERWNIQVQDSWSMGNFDIDTGLGWERSTISQTGDSVLERSFSFIKPRAILTHSASQGSQTRLRVEREVAQLNFNDFVSATLFEDDDVALGNPDLHPDSTWVAEVSHERRFGKVGVIKITGFYHWINDVLDLLPLTATFEAPGNIGAGRRWGTILETTMPLDNIGINDAQLSFNARWQDSTVVDPVTGIDRRLSGEGGFRGDVGFLNENRYAIDIDFRQDIETAQISWGLGLAERDSRVRYKANELDVFNEGFDMTAFIETSRWFGIKLTLEGANLLDYLISRDRTIYVAERSLTDVQRVELRRGVTGQRIFLKATGSF